MFSRQIGHLQLLIALAVENVMFCVDMLAEDKAKENARILGRYGLRLLKLQARADRIRLNAKLPRPALPRQRSILVWNKDRNYGPAGVYNARLSSLDGAYHTSGGMRISQFNLTVK